MNFDIQRFTSITLNPGQTYVTATTTEQSYTLQTTGAKPQIELESLSEEIRALIAEGNATGTVGEVSVNIDAEGNITTNEEVDLASLIGQTVSITGAAEAQTATIGNASVITASSDNGITAGTYELRADATYTTYYSVKLDADGTVTEVTYFDGTTTHTTSANVLSGLTLYGEAAAPTEGTATAAVDNGYAASTAITGLASDTNTAALTYTAADGTVTYQNNGTAIENGEWSVTTYGDYTATGAGYNLTFDNTGKLTAVEGGKLTEDGTGFTVGESTETYTVTATASEGTLTGTITTPAGASVPVEFTVTSTTKQVGFDVNLDGTVDQTLTFTDGKPESDTFTFDNITYTVSAESDTFLATSTQGAAVSATTTTAATQGLGVETVASGTTTTSTLYSGTASAEVQVPGDTQSYGLTFTYADGKVTKVESSYDGTTTTLTADDNGAYTLGSGIALKVAENAFTDGQLVASELTVTTAWNGGSDVSVSDTNNAANTAIDGIKVSKNSSGNLVKFKFDDTHYYAVVLDDKGKVIDFSDDETNGTDDHVIDGITFNTTNTLGFSTDGETWSGVSASIDTNTGTISSIPTSEETGLTDFTIKFNSGQGELSITPGTGTFVASGSDLASLSLSTASDKTYDGASLTATTSNKTTFAGGSGKFGLSLTTPTFGSGVDAGGETYSITFTNIGGYDSGTTAVSSATTAATRWQGGVTIQAGTSTYTFATADLTAWLGTEGYFGTAAGANVKAGTDYEFALGTNGLVYRSTSGTTEDGVNTNKWYKVTTKIGTHASSSGALTYTFTTTATTYTGALLQYDSNKGTLTFNSTAQLGTAVTAADQSVTWDLTGDTIKVTKAMAYDANSADGIKFGSNEGAKFGTASGGDKLVGTLDTYTLAQSTNVAWNVSLGTNNDAEKVISFLTNVGTIGKSQTVTFATGSSLTAIDLSNYVVTANTTTEKGSLKSESVSTWTYKWDTSENEPDSEGPNKWTFTLGTNKLTFGLNSNGSGMGDLTINGSDTGINEDLLKALLWTSNEEDPGVFSGLFSEGKKASATGTAFAAFVTTDTNKAMSTITIKQGSDGKGETVLTLTAEAYLNGSKEVASRTDLKEMGSQTYVAAAGVTSSTFNPPVLSTDTQTITLSSSGATSSASSDGTGSVTTKLTFSIKSGDTTSVYTMDNLDLIADLNGTGQDHVKYTLAHWAGKDATVKGTTKDGKFVYDTSTGIAFDKALASASNNLTVTNTWNIPTELLNNDDNALNISDVTTGAATILSGISLSTADKGYYAIAVKDDKIVAAVYDADGAGTTYSWSDVSVANGVMYNSDTTITGATPDNLTYAYSDTGLVVVGGKSGSVVKLDLKGNGLGNVYGANLTLGADNAITKVAFLDKNGNAIKDTDTLKGLTLKIGTTDVFTGSTVDFTSTSVYASSTGTITLSGGNAKWDGKSAVVVTNTSGGSSAEVLASTASDFSSAIGGTLAEGTVTGTTLASTVTSLTDTTSKDTYNSKVVTGTLADLTLTDKQHIIEINLGNAKYYLVTSATLTDGKEVELSADDKLYNAAGVESKAGLTLSNGTLELGDGGTTAELTYTAATDDEAAKYTLKATSVSNLGLTASIENLSGAEITEVEGSVFTEAELLGADTWANVSKNATTTPTSEPTAQNRIVATYITSQFTSADYAAALAGGAAGITYAVTTADGGYTGMIALGKDNAGADNANAPLLDYSGATVNALYATYTFGSDKTFKLTGLYTDSAATTAVGTADGYSISADGKQIISSGTSNVIAYTLSATTYSDVTISLTSGTPTLSTSAITNVTTATGSTATASDITFADATTPYTFKVAADSTVSVFSATDTTTALKDAVVTSAAGTVTFTDTTNGVATQYVATYTDLTGDGVTTDDTISIVTTALSDTTKLTATATVTLPINGTDVTVTLTASETGTVTVTANTSSGTTVVDPTAYGYTVALVDADSDSKVSAGDYFTYTSTSGDTVSGTTLASTDTGTIAGTTVTRTFDGSTYTFASDSTVTPAAEFILNGITYTANSDGTVSTASLTGETTDLTQTAVSSDTTTYTLTYDAANSQIVLTNTKTGASEVTAVTLATEAYITGINGDKIMIDSNWETQEDGTLTYTDGLTTYTYTPADEDAGTAATCTYITLGEAPAYTFESTEGTEPALLSADGTPITGTFSGTYTTTADGTEISFENLTAEALLAEIQAAMGEDADLSEVEVNITSGETVVATASVGGETSVTEILYNGNVIATIVDNQAEVNGTTLTFEADGTGTYTTATSSDGVNVELNGTSLVVGGGNAATIATKAEDTNIWTLTEDVTEVKNNTGDLIGITSPDGDYGYLADGDTWNVTDNKLTTTADKDSAIVDDQKTVHTSDGVVTGANDNVIAGYLTYTTAASLPEVPAEYESAAYIFGVNSESSLNGSKLDGVEGDNSLDIAIRDGKVLAYNGLSDGATITAAASGTDLTTDENGATVTVADGFNGTINGAEVAVSGDADGIQVTASNDDEIGLISGVSDGATVTAPEDVAVGTDSVAAGETANFNINGTDLALTGEDDGIVVNGNVVSDLDEGAILGGDGVYTVNGTEVALDEDTSVKGGADGTAAAYTADDAVDALGDATAYQKEADPATLKDLIADGTLSAADIKQLDADNITLDDALLGSLNGVRVEAVDGVKIVDESAGDNTIAAGNGGMVRIAKDATGDKVVTAAGATQGAILASNSDNANVTLTGGAGNDTMIASANDVVNLSNGADVVTLRGSGSSTIAGAGVSDASMEVTGFEGGFLADADAANVAIASFNAIDGGKQLVLGSGAKINIKGTAKKAAASSAALTANDYSGDIDNAATAVFGLKNGSDRVALINNNTNYQVASTWSLADNTTSANAFLGEGTVRNTPNNNVGVDFGAITSGSVTPDIERSFTENTAAFRNVQAIAGAAANTTLVGSNTGANELIAGNGATTIIGGVGTADTLYGGGTNGAVIFHNDDQGKDIVAKLGTADAIWTPNLSGVEVDGSDVKVFSLVTDADGNVVRGENALTIANAAATSNPFQIITGVGEDTVGFKADLGAESTYAEDIDFYGNFDDAVTPNKLIVDSTAPVVEGEALAINTGDVSKYWNIRQVDASSYAGDLTVDATLGDDTIIGGAGSNTLWGGAGSDLIQGGSGTNYIKYYMGFDGNDEVTNLKSGDTIELNYLDFLNVSLDDASFATATTTSFDFKMTNGDTLKVSGDLADVTVRINMNGVKAGDFKVNANGGSFSTVNND